MANKQRGTMRKEKKKKSIQPYNTNIAILARSCAIATVFLES